MRTYFPIGADIWADQWAIGHVWSLNIEEHSYIFLAIGALACRQGGACDQRGPVPDRQRRDGLVHQLLLPGLPQRGRISLVSVQPVWITRPAERRSLVCRPPGVEAQRDPVPVAVVADALLRAALVCCSTYSHRGVDRTVAPLCLAYSVVFLDRVPEFSGAACRCGCCVGSAHAPSRSTFGSTPSTCHGEAHSNRTWMAALAIATGALSFYAFEDPLRQAMNRAWTLRVSRRATATLTAGEPEEPPAV